MILHPSARSLSVGGGDSGGAAETSAVALRGVRGDGEWGTPRALRHPLLHPRPLSEKPPPGEAGGGTENPATPPPGGTGLRPQVWVPRRPGGPRGGRDPAGAAAAGRGETGDGSAGLTPSTRRAAGGRGAQPPASFWGGAGGGGRGRRDPGPGPIGPRGGVWSPRGPAGGGAGGRGLTGNCGPRLGRAALRRRKRPRVRRRGGRAGGGGAGRGSPNPPLGARVSPRPAGEGGPAWGLAGPGGPPAGEQHRWSRAQGARLGARGCVRMPSGVGPRVQDRVPRERLRPCALERVPQGVA